MFHSHSEYQKGGAFTELQSFVFFEKPGVTRLPHTETPQQKEQRL